MNRMFDDVFRGLDLATFGPTSLAQDGLGWLQIDIDETDKEVRINAGCYKRNGRRPSQLTDFCKMG
jgi:hypothetical protein